MRVAVVVLDVSTDPAAAAAAACVLQHRLDGKWKFVLEQGQKAGRGREDR